MRVSVSPYDTALLPTASPAYGSPAEPSTTRDPPPSADLPEVHLHELEEQTDGPIIITVNAIAQQLA